MKTCFRPVTDRRLRGLLTTARGFTVIAEVLVLFGVAPVLHAETSVLTLDDYLGQVKMGMPGFRGVEENAEGARLRANESDLLSTPTFFFNGQWASDSKLPALPVFNYEKVNTNNYSLGIAQQTRFGLQARVSYNISYFSYVNPTISGGAPVQFAPYHDTRPTLELTQSLWGNGFGAGTRAQQQALEAQALAASYGAEFQGRSLLREAESAYWRLALARLSVGISQTARERAKRIEEWSARRARLQLGDQSDALQARAALQMRELELESALNEEQSALRWFNHYRAEGSDPSEGLRVPEALEEFKIERMETVTAGTPGRVPQRRDVMAAEQVARATRANAEASRERDLPTLELFGSYALNGRREPLGASLSDPFSAGRPTAAVGVRFSAPLDIGLVRGVRDGWAREAAGADLTFRQKQLDLKFQWTELERQMKEARTRLGLAVELERTQERKLTHERGRFNSGRTTTYQVLVFEQDYAQAQLARIRAQADVLAVAAQVHVFEFQEKGVTP